MRTIDGTKIKEDSEDLKRLLKRLSHRRFIPRIQMLILLKENPKMTLKEMTNLLHFSYPTLKGWWKKYEKGGLKELLDWKVTGYRGKMTEEQLQEFVNELNEKGFSNQREMIEWIYQKFGIRYFQQGISDLLKRIGARKKVGRPVNIRKDENQEKEFKEKIFKGIARENPDKGIFFYDESRFGLMSQVGREWRGRGIKPIIPTIMKFEYRYLYKAVSPITGDSFSFVMPDMTTESLNLFLKEFSKYLGKREAIVVMDNASSHRIKSWKYLQTYR